RHAAHRSGADLAVADELEDRLRRRIAELAPAEALLGRHAAAVAPERCRGREPTFAVACGERPDLVDRGAAAREREPLRDAEREVESRDHGRLRGEDAPHRFLARRKGAALDETAGANDGEPDSLRTAGARPVDRNYRRLRHVETVPCERGR